MLSKKKRIPREMFGSLVKGGKTFKNNLFLLKTSPCKSESRFNFSVSKKVAKSAVLRNKLRRAGYRAIEEYIPKIRSNILATFHFRSVPESSEQIKRNLKSILDDSLL